MNKRIGTLAITLALSMAAAPAAFAQGGRGAAPPPTTKEAAPTDLTGYWVSQIVDEWRFRVTPQKGDILYLPINAQARKVAEAWDPDKDMASGQQCKAYGAVGVMQRPGRMRISWENDTTLRMDFDSGMQSRLLHFVPDPAQKGAPSWQGYSVAHWDLPPRRGFGEVVSQSNRTPGTLKIVTTNLLPGYIRKNGVPYSGGAVLTEYVNRLSGAQNDDYLVVTAVVDDPTYLVQPFVRSYQFKKVADSTGWDPMQCLPR
jgi:hypothetical protein